MAYQRQAVSINPPWQQLTAIDIAGLYEYDDYHVIGTNDYGNGGNGGGCGYDHGVLTIPVFQDGDVLSASKVNRPTVIVKALTLVRLVFGPNYGCDELNRQHFELGGGVILTGDRLVVTISDIDTSGGVWRGDIRWRDRARSHHRQRDIHHRSTSRHNSWDYWKPYRAVVGVVRPADTGRKFDVAASRHATST